MKDEVALLATVTLLGVLLQGELAPVWEVGEGPWGDAGGPRTGEGWTGAGAGAFLAPVKAEKLAPASGPGKALEGGLWGEP